VGDQAQNTRLIEVLEDILQHLGRQGDDDALSQDS